MGSSMSVGFDLINLLAEWRLLLQQWSSSGRLTFAAQEALQLKGVPPTLGTLVRQWTVANFSGLPPVVLLSGRELQGAQGAYAIDTGTIYLNRDWLATAPKARVLAVQIGRAHV